MPAMVLLSEFLRPMGLVAPGGSGKKFEIVVRLAFRYKNSNTVVEAERRVATSSELEIKTLQSVTSSRARVGPGRIGEAIRTSGRGLGSGGGGNKAGGGGRKYG